MLFLWLEFFFIIKINKDSKITLNYITSIKHDSNAKLKINKKDKFNFISKDQLEIWFVYNHRHKYMK